MKRLPVVILVLIAVLGAVVSGCGDTHRYDSRLAAADSLMHDYPDSALSVLTAIDTVSLASEADRAYRDLLLTQARYKAYITATSDSDINRALAYYLAHPKEREKLTRAFIYKGAVMDELGLIDSALIYYKYAESNAAPDDYFNLGYAKMRIATLYQDQISQDSAAINRIKQAIHYFKILSDTNYLISCYGKLGAICGMRYPDSTEHYLIQAIELAELSNSDKQYTYKSKLAGFNLYKKKDYRQANILSMDVLRNGRDKSAETQFYYYAALSYIELGLMDSARYVFSQTPIPTDNVDSMNYFNILAELEKYENHPEMFAAHAVQSMGYTNTVISSSKEKELVKTEIEFEKHKLENQNSTLVKHKDNLIHIVMIVIIVSILLVIFLIMSYKKLKQRQSEIEQIGQKFENLRRELDYQKSKISKYVSYRILAMKELYSSVRYKKKGDSSRIKKIIPLSSVFKEIEDKYEPLKLNLPDSFWDKLKVSVDGEFKGIVSFVERRYPDMNDNDIRLFCLLCAEVSPQIIKLCMDYSSPKTSSSYRNRIIRKKMGLDMTFDEFIKNYMSGEIF